MGQPSVHTPSIAFRHLPPRKDVVNQCLQFALSDLLGRLGLGPRLWGWGWGSAGAGLSVRVVADGFLSHSYTDLAAGMTATFLATALLSAETVGEGGRRRGAGTPTAGNSGNASVSPCSHLAHGATRLENDPAVTWRMVQPGWKTTRCA